MTLIKSRFLLTVLGVVSVPGWSCQPAEEARLAAATRDSAGIGIVDNETPAWRPGDEWTVAADSFVAVQLGNDTATMDISVAIRLGNGTFVVADDASKTLRWIGSDNSSTTGRLGDGPGEFRSFSLVAATSLDSLIVWDGTARRASVVHAGKYIRAFTLKAPADWVAPSIRGALANGRLLGVPLPVPLEESPAGVHRPDVPAGVFTPAGDLAIELGRFPSAAVEYRPSTTRGAVLRLLVPFGPSTIVAAGGDWIVVGDNARYELFVYDAAGQMTRIVRLPSAAEPVTEKDLERELQRRLEGAPPIEEIRAGIRASFRSTPAAERQPHFDRVLVDQSNYIWIRRRHSSEGSQWDVVRPDGAWLGGVRTPAGLEVQQIGEDFVLGLWANAEGVNEVRSYRLRRGRSP